ncbi:hypothetical protein [Microbispora bryophytorum]|uniref:Polysaccharide chain length determinant N-terminal domain-containing protein n=1 Tax=Microbispora bryophytorum subsp. camponoti TaxID=1677852 RepID=A0ABR8KZG9_9ACTN|nr:hypothetical protein [Microbispora camponoti]MBD3143082.1 hypothetical protein [Microbispora camponoti]
MTMYPSRVRTPAGRPTALDRPGGYVEFWTTTAGLLRKWSIGLPLLAISILAGTVTFVLAPTRYEADTSLVLATPVNGGVYSRDPNRPLPRGNPLLQFNDALKTAASIVIQSMNTQDVWTQLGAPKDGPTTITIDDGRSNPRVLDISGPYIYIRVVAPSPAVASGVLTKAQRRVRDELTGWQQTLGAPPSTYLTVANIVPASKPEAMTSTRWQLAAGVGLLVACAGLGLAYALTRRGRVPLLRNAPPPPREPAPPAPAARPAVPVAPIAPVAPVVSAYEDDDVVLWDTQEIVVVTEPVKGQDAAEALRADDDRRFASVTRDARTDDDKD